MQTNSMNGSRVVLVADSNSQDHGHSNKKNSGQNKHSQPYITVLANETGLHRGTC